MEAVILAGGLGTRLRATVKDVPKPMAPVRDRPFLEILLDYWLAQGVSRFILSVGYKKEVIQEHFGSSYRNIPVDYAVESTPLGTGGGLLLALDQLKSRETFLALNGDTFFGVNLDAFANFHRESQAQVSLALFKAPPAGRYNGVGLGDDRSIRSFGNRSEGQAGGHINGGVYLIHPQAFATVRKRAGEKISLEDEVFPALVDSGVDFRGYVADARFIDIGMPEDYKLAQNFF
ncbi:MAG: NTP transferase domain-containing protein [Candidatus Nitrohelix vancouverensis]|uniref:NTP transferase domain-containing protein n=1 Tax=Candidatus Nitrohelix vancouverensis TaxID=2705534 RepID=A0A7T0C2D2_9BACT|nr:MAG: NTP transferase domain-containing protein [Candidatus Nitrohelix vancouverensis]